MLNNNCKNFNNKGISLIEIIVTITIAFLLSAISIYSYQDYRIKALFNNALAIAEQNKLAISNFYASNKQCPTRNFISQEVNRTQCLPSTTNSCIRTIANDDSTNRCILNLRDANGKTVMYFQAMLSSVGEFQYFCVPGELPAPNKYLSITCAGLPASGSGLSSP